MGRPWGNEKIFLENFFERAWGKKSPLLEIGEFFLENFIRRTVGAIKHPPFYGGG